MNREARQIASFVAAVARAIRASGGNLSRALVFEALNEAGADGWQLGPLASHLHQDKSSVRRWLQKMVAEGHALREDNSYRLTAAGAAEFERRVNLFLRACSPETRVALRRAVGANQK